MKHSLTDHALKLTEEEYHAYPAWSHSLISRYAREGFAAIATIHDPIKTTPAMEFGSLFDSILTKGRSTLDEYVVDRSNTTCEPAEKAVFDTLLSMGFTEPYDSLSSLDIQQAYETCDTFCSKYKKEETRLKKLSDACGYYDLRRQGKKIVSGEDWDDAIEMARIFRNDSYLSSLFGTKNSEDVEYIYQAKFVIDYTTKSGKNIKLKFMPDLLIVNHKERTIRYVDLKTSSMPAYDFAENFLKFRYDIESAVYTDGLNHIIANDDGYRDYTVLPTLFVDISRTDKVPVTYEYNPYDESQMNGLSFKDYHYKDYHTLLDEMVEYEDSQATVPSYIITDGPNDMISILNAR